MDGTQADGPFSNSSLRRPLSNNIVTGTGRYVYMHVSSSSSTCSCVCTVGRTRMHASMYPRWGFRFTWCVACAASAPHCRTACMPGAPPPPLLQLHAGSSSPVTRSQDRSRGCAATMPCYLHARTLRAQHAARSIARLAVARSQPPRPGRPSTDHTGMQAGPGAAACACACWRGRVREQTHGSVTRPCRSRASL